MGYFDTTATKVQHEQSNSIIDADTVRLIIPNTKKISGVVRIFCKTGPTYGDNVIADHIVSVDVLLPG